MGPTVAMLVDAQFWSMLKYLSNYWVDCNDILYRHSWYPEDRHLGEFHPKEILRKFNHIVHIGLTRDSKNVFYRYKINFIYSVSFLNDKQVTLTLKYKLELEQVCCTLNIGIAQYPRLISLLMKAEDVWSKAGYFIRMD